MDAGFKTHESFTRAFQRQFGITPNEYRNNFLKASHARKKQIQPKYIADYNMHDETGLLANGSASAGISARSIILPVHQSHQQLIGSA
ncbi:MAG: AraC family transcriptional regulator [Anaerolineales bacterium]|nr:AraC family transcriptional regulator [Anaerolineales bacterium]